MISDPGPSMIRALGTIEGFKDDIRKSSARLDNLPLWRPAAGLKKQCGRVLDLIGDLEDRLERKLVVTILGPSGAGKSTLLNALAGVDGLSEVGHQRPTTRGVMVLSKEPGDIEQLVNQLGTEHVQLSSSPAAEILKHVILIDTPDTDSMEQARHIPIIHGAIALSDVLICIFDAENPKRKDHVDFMASHVRLFHGESLVAVLNKCDRQEEKELRDKILPEFLAYVAQAWKSPVHKAFCISARNHLNDPGWDPHAVPRHDFDQFEGLRELIFGTFNQPGYVIDRRLENALNLRNYLSDEIQAEAGKDKERLTSALKCMQETAKNALGQALTVFKEDDAKQLTGLDAILYQHLAHRWIGPVGWLIAMWARILIFGTGIASVFRFGDPLRQMLGALSPLWHFKESRAAVDAATRDEGLDAALREYRHAIMQEWPNIAEDLVKGRFDSSIRRIEEVIPDPDAFGDQVAALWRDMLSATIEKLSRRLSGFVIQIIFNIPVVGILCHTGWITARQYFTGNYLASEFFLHAFLAICISLFLTFFIYQGLVRLVASPSRITRKAFKRMKRRVEQLQILSKNSVEEQAMGVVELGGDYRIDTS
ncbi:GTPase [Thermodesulfobacteriota bacterium]